MSTRAICKSMSERIKKLEAALAAATSQVALLQASIKRKEAKIERLTQDVATAHESVETLCKSLESSETSRDALQRRVKELESSISTDSASATATAETAVINARAAFDAAREHLKKRAADEENKRCRDLLSRVASEMMAGGREAASLVMMDAANILLMEK